MKTRIRIILFLLLIDLSPCSAACPGCYGPDKSTSRRVDFPKKSIFAHLANIILEDVYQIIDTPSEDACAFLCDMKQQCSSFGFHVPKKLCRLSTNFIRSADDMINWKGEENVFVKTGEAFHQKIMNIMNEVRDAEMEKNKLEKPKKEICFEKKIFDDFVQSDEFDKSIDVVSTPTDIPLIEQDITTLDVTESSKILTSNPPISETFSSLSILPSIQTVSDSPVIAKTSPVATDGSGSSSHITTISSSPLASVSSTGNSDTLSDHSSIAMPGGTTDTDRTTEGEDSPLPTVTNGALESTKQKGEDIGETTYSTDGRTTTIIYGTETSTNYGYKDSSASSESTEGTSTLVTTRNDLIDSTLFSTHSSEGSSQASTTPIPIVRPGWTSGLNLDSKVHCSETECKCMPGDELRIKAGANNITAFAFFKDNGKWKVKGEEPDNVKVVYNSEILLSCIKSTRERFAPTCPLPIVYGGSFTKDSACTEGVKRVFDIHGQQCNSANPTEGAICQNGGYWCNNAIFKLAVVQC